MPGFWEHVSEKDHTFFVREWFARAEHRRGRVLDLPAGNGGDTDRIAAAGYDVVSADLFPEYFQSSRRGGLVQADMSGALPFDDASFDYVLHSEGIEHLQDQMAFLAECGRVLRPGGLLALTTPNLLSLRGRVAFALAGQRAFKSFVDEVTSVWGQDGARIYHGHAFLINYFQLRYMLWHTGFRIREVVGTHYGTSSILMLPLAPLVWAFTRKAMKRAIRKNPGSDIYPEILDHVTSLPMLLSKNLFLIAEKRKSGTGLE